MKNLAEKYNISIGEGTCVLTLKDMQSAIDLSREVTDQEWSGDNILQCAKEELISTLESYNTPTNMVLLLLHRNSSEISLAEVAELVDILRSYNSNVLFGYDNNAETDKLISIIQAR